MTRFAQPDVPINQIARSVYLIGFSGTGKTTVARLVAAQLGVPAVDIDGWIASATGMTIPEIFANEGEAGFRRRESVALLALDPPLIVATGGGAVLDADNREEMATGWVITLEARPETILARTQQQRASEEAEGQRPLLEHADPLARITALKAERQSLYALADWTVHTDRLDAAAVAAEVVRAVRLLEKLV